MSDDHAGAAASKVTLYDVKKRAENVRDLAIAEVKHTAKSVVDDDTGRTLMAVAAVVVVVASVAFMIGARSRSDRTA